MSLARKIIGNASIRVVARLSGNVIGVTVVAILTRYLGQEGFGNYTTILAYLFFFGALSDLGLYMITINEINKAGVDRSRFFSAIFSLRFYTGLVLMVLAGILIWFFPYPSIVKQGVLIVSLSILFNLLDQIQVAVYQAELKMVRVALADFAGKVVLIALMLFGISQGYSLLPLLWAVVAGHAVQWLITFTGLQRRLPFKLGFDKDYWRQIIAKTWPIALSQVFVLIYFKMDTIFLSLLRPQAVAQLEVGVYGAAYKILEVLIALVPIFMGLVAPVLAQAWSHNLKEKFQSMYQQTFDAFAIVVLPMVLGGIMLARPIMNLIAPGFEHADTILQILMVATGVIFFAHIPGFVIVILNQQRRLLKAYAFVAGLSVLLYIILIPFYSYYAAAVISVLLELLVLMVSWRRVTAVTRQKIKWQVFAKAGLAALIMTLGLWLLQGLNLFFLLIIGVAIYFAVLFMFRGITKELISRILFSKSV